MHFIENFQLCHSFFPRPNISDRFVSFAFFLSVSKYSRYICGGRNEWLSVMLSFKKNTEGESELKNRIFGYPAASKKRWDICKTNFSDFVSNFLLLGGVFHKCSKSKYHSIHQNKFFGTHFVCEKHPLHVFCFFPSFACVHFLKLFHLPIFEELRKVHAKNFMFSVKIGREPIFQSWQLYDLFHTQCYNFAIVHCLHCHLHIHRDLSAQELYLRRCFWQAEPR